MFGGISVIVGPLWQTFVSSLKVYERASVEGVEDSYDGRYDSDGAEKSLESFVIQVIKIYYSSNKLYSLPLSPKVKLFH